MASDNTKTSDTDSGSSRQRNAAMGRLIGAIVTIVIAAVAGGIATYAVIREQLSHNPKHLIGECKNSIKRIERSLSKDTA